METNSGAASSIRKTSTLKGMKRKRYAWAYLFILPQVIFYLAFTFYPIIMSYVYTLYDWGGIGPLKNFVGLDNFKRLFNDAQFWKSYRNSMVYMVGSVLFIMPLSLLLAIVLNSKKVKWKVFFRTVYFIPAITTAAIVAVVMKMIFGSGNAFFNSLLMSIGILDEPQRWLLHPDSAMVILIVIGSWLYFGMCMIYWLAILQSLPPDLFEAAKIDGANAWNSFIHITIPQLIPASLVILLLTILQSFHVFDLVLPLTGGGPFFATQTVDLFIYKLIFTEGAMPRFGYGSAAGVTFGLSVFAISATLGLLIRKVRGKSKIAEMKGRI